MRKFILSALVALMASPAFANDQFGTAEVAPDESSVTQDFSLLEENMTPVEPTDVATAEEIEAQQRRFICYSRNLFGQTFWGAGWFPRQAARRSLWACRRGSIFGVCRFIGCRRGW